MNFLYCIDENYNIQTLTSIKSLSKCVSKEINIYNSQGTKNFLAHKEKDIENEKYKKYFYL